MRYRHQNQTSDCCGSQAQCKQKRYVIPVLFKQFQININFLKINPDKTKFIITCKPIHRQATKDIIIHAGKYKVSLHDEKVENVDKEIVALSIQNYEKQYFVIKIVLKKPEKVLEKMTQV